jgi:hypothetical protein
MGSHDSFGHLKHKLWPKERSGIKLAVWLLTIKSQESTRLPCVQMECNILLKSFWQRLQLCFRTHLNQRPTHKVTRPPKLRESQLWEFQDSHLGVLGQNVIWIWASWRGTKYTIRGGGGGFLQVWVVVSFMNPSLLVARPSTKNAPAMH